MRFRSGQFRQLDLEDAVVQLDAGLEDGANTEGSSARRLAEKFQLEFHWPGDGFTIGAREAAAVA